MDNIKQNHENFIKEWLNVICMTPLGALGVILLVCLPMIPPFNQEYLIRWLVVGGIFGAAAMAFDFTGGFINIINFGFYGFVGLGGYTSAILATKFGVSPWIGMFCGALAAAILGFLAGVLTLRLRGIFALCLTWFIGLALMGLATKMVPLTRGPLGLRCPRLFESLSNLPYYYVIIGMMIVIYIVCQLILRSKLGLAFRAIGQNMEAARSSGINPTFYRIVNFTVSCAFAGWIGGFYAHYYAILTPDVMSTGKTTEVLIVAYIGGRGSLWGGAAVGFPFVCALEFMRSSLANLPGINLIIYGLFLILLMIYYPGGAAQLYKSVTVRSNNRFVNFLT